MDVGRIHQKICAAVSWLFWKQCERCMCPLTVAQFVTCRVHNFRWHVLTVPRALRSIPHYRSLARVLQGKKDVAQIFNNLLRRQYGTRNPTVDHIGQKSEILFLLVRG